MRQQQNQSVNPFSKEKPNVILYAYTGAKESSFFPVDKQIEILRDYCDEEGYNIVAQATDARAMNQDSNDNIVLDEVLSFCRFHHRRHERIHKVLFTSWHRVAHDIDEVASSISTLREMGIEVRAIDNEFYYNPDDLNAPENEVIRLLVKIGIMDFCNGTV